MMKKIFTSILLLAIFSTTGCQLPVTEQNSENESQSTTTNLTLDVTKNDSPYMGDTIGGTTTPLLEFTPEDYQQAQDQNKLIVLYFYANWCPICQEEFNNQTIPAFNQLDNPSIIGFRVNFNDDETTSQEKDLARQFGVAYQHTKVFTQNNEKVLKAPDSWDQNRYIEEINNYTNQ